MFLHSRLDIVITTIPPPVSAGMGSGSGTAMVNLDRNVASAPLTPLLSPLPLSPLPPLGGVSPPWSPEGSIRHDWSRARSPKRYWYEHEDAGTQPPVPKLQPQQSSGFPEPTPHIGTGVGVGEGVFRGQGLERQDLERVKSHAS